MFAGKIFLKQCASVSESERNQAKTLCLGIIYGMVIRGIWEFREQQPNHRCVVQGPAALSKQLSALREARLVMV